VNEIPVSVVMPTYNGSKFIKRAIDSILAQTHTNFEFLIIDDGSTDNTAEIIHSFNDTRIKYFYQDNRGPASAYNTGFRNASTDFIFIMDHDDYSYPTRIEKQLEYIQKNDVDVCGTNYEILHERNGYIEKVNRSFKDCEIKEKLLFLPWIILNPTVCIRKKIFDQFGYFDDSYNVAFDYEFYVRVIDKITFGIVPAYLYRWYQHKNSYSSKTAVQGRRVFRQIALSKIEENKSVMPPYKYFETIGLLNYYSDKMSIAIIFLASSVAHRLDKRTLKYFFIITLFGFIIKIVRKYSLFSLPIIRDAKKYFVVQ
jgi:glycosyltransferase involved in cell wall biosynthesis